MEAREVILRPMITEKAMLAEDSKKYTFEVDVRANKTHIKQAIEEIFGVKVKNVNVMNVRGKLKRMGKYSGYTKKRRKAVVTLTADSKDIEFFEAE
ncbi:MAG: 50S ribosomal protein L23 [Desemzia incerta]|uniref:Large ribosomal subunit protein uL23 n=1 Tax=Desemzia incerta TaxID=82801 RepID=A0A1I5YBJ6_9LACT|nr:MULTISPECIES: 50S ribosomal protein L23 [Desemzia]MBM6615101.1 50S ribosomal protein L23 [Desemzia sp. RIT 804]MCI3028452.1 50S ribosomal protein L23 [Desemzia sp. C1]WHZ32610.1 50S ribosomal protein L23 [Desemzia incerta]SFQ41267.1 LSU ribosomal protein L23P [Desemzia incerta]